jgi:hypothetical protein
MHLKQDFFSGLIYTGKPWPVLKITVTRTFPPAISNQCPLRWQQSLLTWNISRAKITLGKTKVASSVAMADFGSDQIELICCEAWCLVWLKKANYFPP